MSAILTIQELFRFDDWGNRKVLELAAPLPDALLDRPFEMGSGSLRKTLQHMHGAAAIWLDRWKGIHPAQFPPSDATAGMSALAESIRRTAEQRDAFVAGFDDAKLAAELTFANLKGERHTRRFVDLMLHVVNHGVHHRAQAANMLRHLGVKAPRMDYIFMKIEQGAAPPLEASRPLLRRYFAYNDWAFQIVAKAAAGLPDAALDQPFEMGLGTLRKTLIHLRDAERWWVGNWQRGPDRLFPEMDGRPPLAEIHDGYLSAARERDACLASEADLRRIVRGQPVKDVFREFPIAVTMLQLCVHGTHHRAQAINMIRRTGGQAPAVDLVLFAGQNREAT